MKTTRQFLPVTMTMDYVRVRKDTLHQLQRKYSQKEPESETWIILTIVAIIVALAVIGLSTVF